MYRRIPLAASTAFLALSAAFALSQCAAQPPGEGSQRGSRQAAPSADRIVSRMMAFDKNKDGRLTRDEITDSRLLRLFDRADTNHDGVVTKEELTDLAKKMVAESSGRGGSQGPGGGFGGNGPDDFGPPGGFGPGGFGPGGPGRGGPPQPGQVVSPRMQEMLKLTAEQKKQLNELQKEVDEKMAKILTDEQKKQLKELRPRRGDGPPPGRGSQGDGPEGNGPPQEN